MVLKLRSALYQNSCVARIQDKASAVPTMRASAPFLFTRLSFPIITPDRQRVFMDICENCNMMLGGSGYQVLYEKKNGKWSVHSSYNFWISEANRKREEFLALR